MALMLKWTAKEVNGNIIKRSILMGKSRERSAPVGSSGPTPVKLKPKAFNGAGGASRGQRAWHMAHRSEVKGHGVRAVGSKY